MIDINKPLAAALAAALLATALLGWQYLAQRDTIAALRRDIAHAEMQTGDARAAAQACSDSVAELRTQADALQQQLLAARAAAQQAAREHYTRADAILATPQPVPGDVCASAQARVRDILAGRAQR